MSLSDQELQSYDWILINSSGGKDSQTMLRKVVRRADFANISRRRLVVVHADLGRVEWAGTKELVRAQAEHYGLRFEVMKRPQGDLLDHVEQRGKWPGPQQRYCTSDHKRGQVQKVMTMLHREHTAATGSKYCRILNCMGLRAEESPARAKKPEFTWQVKGTTQKRTVSEWLPILDWTEDEVWQDIKASGVPYHPAYDLGMPRLSCCFCIFAPRSALVLAGHHNRALLEEYVRVEHRIQHTFRKELSMADIAHAVERGEAVDSQAMSGAWNM